MGIGGIHWVTDLEYTPQTCTACDVVFVGIQDGDFPV